MFENLVVGSSLREVKRYLFRIFNGCVTVFCCFSADAVNNAAGYGFLGIDESGRPSWDLISNLNIIGIEVNLRKL